MPSGYAVVSAKYLFILQNDDFCTLSQFLYRFITFPIADTATPSPLTTDSGFFSPSIESTASSPRGTSVIRASLRELTLEGYSYVHITVTAALVPSVEIVCNNYRITGSDYIKTADQLTKLIGGSLSEPHTSESNCGYIYLLSAVRIP